MSRRVFWVPIVKPPEGFLSDDLYHILKSSISSNPSTITDEEMNGLRIGEKDIPFLRGVAAASLDPDIRAEANSLVRFIAENGPVKVVVER